MNSDFTYDPKSSVHRGEPALLYGTDTGPKGSMEAGMGRMQETSRVDIVFSRPRTVLYKQEL